MSYSGKKLTMSVVAYYRVSTDDQNIENQRMELEKTYKIDKEFSDQGISGTVKTDKRSGFSAMLDYLREGDTLVTVDLDRLGRDSIDVQQTIASLKARGVNIIIARMGVDLNSDAGELLITIMSKVAEMERKKMLERQRAGIERARSEGKYKGKQSINDHKAVYDFRQEGNSISATAEHFSISPATVKRLQAKYRSELQTRSALQTA